MVLSNPRKPNELNIDHEKPNKKQFNDRKHSDIKMIRFLKPEMAASRLARQDRSENRERSISGIGSTRKTNMERN